MKVKPLANVVVVIALVAPTSLWSTPALAEPTPTVKYLTNEPASLMDIGLVRLDAEVKEWMGNVRHRYKGNPASASADYGPGENRIVITVGYPLPEERSLPADVPKACAYQLDLIRKVARFSSLPSFFLHRDGAPANAPSGTKEEIEKIMRIDVVFLYDFFSSGSDGAFKHKYKCSGSLTGRDVAVSQSKM